MEKKLQIKPAKRNPIIAGKPNSENSNPKTVAKKKSKIKSIFLIFFKYCETTLSVK